MKYTCRVSPSGESLIHRLDGQLLQVLNEHGEVKQTVELGTLRRIQQYVGFAGDDAKNDQPATEYCRIAPARGRSIHLCNGNFIPPAEQTDGTYFVSQHDAYLAFLLELKRRVAKENPGAWLLHGRPCYSLAWCCSILCGMGLIAIPSVTLMRYGWVAAGRVGMYFLPIGLGLFSLGVATARMYWPTLTTVGKDLQKQSELSSAATEAGEL